MPDSGKKSEFLSVRVSPAVKEKLEKIAKKNERTMSWVIAKIIDKHLGGKAPDKL